MESGAFQIDVESFRARQSELVDMSLIHVGLQLREIGIDFSEEELAALPAPFPERLLRHIELFKERDAKLREAVEEHRAKEEKAQMRLESLRDATERAKGELAILSEKISFALSEYRKDEKLDSENQRERQRELQDLFRHIEKKELELRRETMEHERLNKMLKKVTK